MENEDKKTRYAYRFLARVVIEATTPMSIGSGEKDIKSDHLVARDVNGLPYIPGTAIAGIVRHAIGKDKAEKFFGFDMTEAEKEKRKNQDEKRGGKKGQEESLGEGSKVIFSSAHLVMDKSGDVVVEGLLPKDFNNEYLKNFRHLPIRQHVRISEKGTTAEKGKFDEEVVYKGARFCFEIEMLTEKDETTFFDEILSLLASDTLSIGSGTRSGHGEFVIAKNKVVDGEGNEQEECLCKKKILDLSKADELLLYINKTSSLNDPFWANVAARFNPVEKPNGWISYELNLQPEDFFLFGSGFGNENADMSPVTEVFVDWSGEAPKMTTDCILIPGSSVKGALSHRVAYHYNKLTGVYADKIAEILKNDENLKKANNGELPSKDDIIKKFKNYVGENNKAVRALFGYAISDKEVQRGNVIISDMIEHELMADKRKVLNHVAIDRFTGGAIDSALFSEEVVYGENDTYTLPIKVCMTDEVTTDKTILPSFENALRDLATGRLPLGGGTNRGHGCFNGTIKKETVELDLKLIKTIEQQSNEQNK